MAHFGSALSAQPLKSLFEQVVFILCEAIVCALRDRLNVQDEAMASRHGNLE